MLSAFPAVIFFPKLRLRLSQFDAFGSGVPSKTFESAIVESVVFGGTLSTFAGEGFVLIVDWPHSGQKILDAGTRSPQPEHGDGGVTA